MTTVDLIELGREHKRLREDMRDALQAEVFLLAEVTKGTPGAKGALLRNAAEQVRLRRRARRFCVKVERLCTESEVTA